ncbi:flagellar hook-length control protein FliK [uncultured Bradyrhizobium sp.]|uniref:flagellar hook-length control protein FliK n=1 Tax=uncultured Bradyrhizobium sp. TaxID=199684 RepID=UPI0035CA7DF5
MPISVNPIFPVIAAQGAAPDVVLQPGTVIDAQVLKILANDLVRIAIAGVSIEVVSEIPLQVGQALQLAVSQTPEGVKLAAVGQGGAMRGEGVPASAAEHTGSSDVVSPDLISPAINAPAAAAAKPAANPTSPKHLLTLPEAMAVSAAAQTAAARQGSLAPLFANLAAIAGSNALPPKLQQAVAQLLALRPNLDQNLSGGIVKTAFRNSGLFLESSLGSKSAAPAREPDLKAALAVLRQTLLTLGGIAALDGKSFPTSTFRPQGLVAGQVRPDIALDISPDMAGPAPRPQIAAVPALGPSLAPEIDVEEVFLPQARLPVADDFAESNGVSRIFTAAGMPSSTDHVTRPAVTAAILSLLQEVPQALLQKAGNSLGPVLNEDIPRGPLPSPSEQRTLHNDDGTTARAAAPPPFRGALPSAQPVVPPSLAPDVPQQSAVRHLLDETDAALARQTLLQVASLPERAEVAGTRTDPAARWNFEIPFATLSGTAIAHFEISGDGNGSTIGAAKRVWRARFSLDVEPAGPVHVLISLSDDTTSIRMWAERPATATQLRAGASQLSQALHRAELQSGDIVIRQGAPAQSAPPPAGHFLDRAL